MQDDIKNLLNRYPNCKTLQMNENPNNITNKDIYKCLLDINNTGGFQCPGDYNIMIDFIKNGGGGSNTQSYFNTFKNRNLVQNEITAPSETPTPTSNDQVINILKEPITGIINNLDKDDDYYNVLLESSTFLRNLLNQSACIGGVYNNKLSQMTNIKLSDKTISRIENIINRLTGKKEGLQEGKKEGLQEGLQYKDYIIISLIAIIVVMLIFFYFKFNNK